MLRTTHEDIGCNYVVHHKSCTITAITHLASPQSRLRIVRTANCPGKFHHVKEGEGQDKKDWQGYRLPVTRAPIEARNRAEGGARISLTYAGRTGRVGKTCAWIMYGLGEEA